MFWWWRRASRMASCDFFYFIYCLTRLQSQKSKLWSFLAVRVLALSRPEVSASSYKQRTKRERGERRKKICTVNLEKQQGAWMNGVQNWGYSSLMINCKNFESISCPKPVLPLQMVIRPCFEALQVLWCRCRSHDGGWEGIPCCNRSVRKWSQDGVVGLSREGNRELERVRLGELASRSWLRRRRSLWGEQVGERREARTTHQFVE